MDATFQAIENIDTGVLLPDECKVLERLEWAISKKELYRPDIRDGEILELLSRLSRERKGYINVPKRLRAK